METEVQHSPVPVTIKNWDDRPKPKVCSSSFQTYFLDPTATGKTFVEIGAFEPSRERLIIHPIDAPVVVYLQQPSTTPDVASVLTTPYPGARLLMPITSDRVGEVISNPAAGADDVITVPAGESWRLDNILLRLVTSAVVGNRQVTLLIDDGNPTNVIYTLQTAVNQAQSVTQDYIFSVGVQEIALRGGIQQEPLPPLMLSSGMRIRTVTTGIGVADQYGPDIVNYTKLGSGGNGLGLYEFFGNDAMWINSITGSPTRVTVTKEYRA